MPADYWCSLTARSKGQLTTGRGRQYELDQVQTGTWAGSLVNTDAALDPGNASSPFYPKVLPYRMFRHRMQYPPTANILTADQASALYASRGYLSTSTLPANTYQVGTAAPLAVVAGSSVPSNRFAVNYPATCAAGNGMRIAGWSVAQGSTYTAQANLALSAAVTLSAYLALRWFDVNGATISDSSATVALSTTGAVYTVTGTAPANAVGAELRLTNATVPASAVNLYAQEIQLEVASSASSWVTPSPWYSVFTGYVERWPQSWTQSGMFGTSDIVVVDAFGFLSQRKVLSSAYMEFLAMGPNFLYPLDESSSASLAYDLVGNYPAVGFANLLFNNGGPSAFGDTLTNAGTTGYVPQGIGGPVLGLFRDVLDLSERGVTGPPASGGWTRVLAFQITQALPFNGKSWIWQAADASGTQTLFVEILNQGGYSILVGTPDGNILGFNSDASAPLGVGGWHLIAVSYDGSGTFTARIDGATPATLADALGSRTWAADWVANSGTGSSAVGLEMALVGELPFVITDTQWNTFYSTFRWGGSGEGVASSTTRYQDILRWGGWAGLQAVDSYTTGETTAYGPATELNAAASSSGTDVVSALQTVVDTDAGTHYVAADGTVTFKARRARYNQGTPVVTFGENTAVGEVPYTLVQTGYDPSRIANDISTVQTQTSVTQRAVDATSVSNYGDIQLQRTVNTLEPYELSDAAQYLLSRNSRPVQRIEGVSVDVGANPSLWGKMLSLELGSRVRVMRRPPAGAATIQVDGFVEQLNWTFDDKGHAAVDLQISVNNGQQFWQLDSSTYSVLDSTTIIGY